MYIGHLGLNRRRYRLLYHGGPVYPTHPSPSRPVGLRGSTFTTGTVNIKVAEIGQVIGETLVYHLEEQRDGK